MACKKLPEGIDSQRVLILCDQIIEKRSQLLFPDVARAICVSAYVRKHVESQDDASDSGYPPKSEKRRGVALAALYNILFCTKQNVNNWIRRDLDGWCRHWSDQLKEADLNSHAPVKRRRRVNADDWCWILGEMESRRSMQLSFEKHAQQIRRKAVEDPSRQHLATISHQLLRRRGWNDEELSRYGIKRQVRQTRAAVVLKARQA